MYAFLLVPAILALAPLVAGIKFDLEARHDMLEKCIWDYALVDQLVVVTINAVFNSPIQDQALDVQIVDGSEHNNVYWSQRNVRTETRMAINSHSDSDMGVCFINRLTKSTCLAPLAKQGERVLGRESVCELTLLYSVWKSDIHNPQKPYRATIDLDIDIGAEAVDYNAIANQESLSEVETELRKLDNEVVEIFNQMDYLKRREQRMRSTDESTNLRVHYFAWLTVIGLVVMGIWQMVHLHNFFRKKYLID